MADDGGGKRQKSSRDNDDDIAELRKRNSVLESHNLRRETEIAQLGRVLRSGQRQRNHEELPVVVLPSTVDLSRVDSSIVAYTSSFLITSCELLNLALTCKSFGWAPSALNLSLVEDVARQAVCARATDDELRCLRKLPMLASLDIKQELAEEVLSGANSWLSILYGFEHLLVFDALFGKNFQHVIGDKTTVHNPNTSPRTAISSQFVMRSGSHYTEFLITGNPHIGIVRPMPNLDFHNPRLVPFGTSFGMYYIVGHHSRYLNFRLTRTYDWGDGRVHACEYKSGNGVMSWADFEAPDHRVGLENSHYNQLWEGYEGCVTGDTVGMLLNLDNGTLTVYKNNRRLGVMKDGLSGPYTWYTTLLGGNEVTIRRGTLDAQQQSRL